MPPNARVRVRTWLLVAWRAAVLACAVAPVAYALGSRFLLHVALAVVGTSCTFVGVGFLVQRRDGFTRHDHAMANLVGGTLVVGGVLLCWLAFSSWVW